MRVMHRQGRVCGLWQAREEGGPASTHLAVCIVGVVPVAPSAFLVWYRGAEQLLGYRSQLVCGCGFGAAGACCKPGLLNLCACMLGAAL